MLGKYIKVDNVTYPNPTSTNVSFENNEKVNKSEAGTDLVSAIRLQKLTIKFTFQVSSYWRDIIRTDSRKLNVALNFGGNVYNGRLRVSGEVLAKNSENVSSTDGFWTMTVSFVER